MFNVSITAPTNDAFDAAVAEMPDLLDMLLDPANISLLQTILKYHVVEGALYSTDAANGEVMTLSGEPFTVTVDEATGGVKINDANVILADIPASNGVIHVLDSVLSPPSLGSDTTTVAAPTTVGEGSTTGATTTSAVSTTAAVEGSETTTLATTTGAGSTTAAVVSETTTSATETVMVGGSTTFATEAAPDATTTAPLETVSPTSAPAPKSG